MKTTRRLLFVFAALAGFIASLGAAVDRFDRTKLRIDALLGRRLHPPALPEKVPDPFSLVGTNAAPDKPRTLFEVAPAEPTHGPKVDAAGVPLTGDDDVLAFFAAMVKVNGQLQVSGTPLIIINQSPYKEGDLIQLHARDGVAYFLRLIKVSPNEYTIGYNEAVRTIPIKN